MDALCCCSLCSSLGINQDHPPSLPIETCNMDLIDAHCARLKGAAQPISADIFDTIWRSHLSRKTSFLFLCFAQFWASRWCCMKRDNKTCNRPLCIHNPNKAGNRGGIAFRLRNRFLLRQRFSNSLASSARRKEKKNRNVGRYPILYFSCGLFCPPPPPPLLLVAGIVQFFGSRNRSVV